MGRVPNKTRGIKKRALSGDRESIIAYITAPHLDPVTTWSGVGVGVGLLCCRAVGL